jgi:hypothetical protein
MRSNYLLISGDSIDVKLKERKERKISVSALKGEEVTCKKN